MIVQHAIIREVLPLMFVFALTNAQFEGIDESKIVRAINLDDVGEGMAKKEVLPPCKACRTLADSFIVTLDKTKRNQYEGGDSDWESKKMKSYTDSEIRFIEIQERVCSDVIRGKEQCHMQAEEHEAILEEWYYNERKLTKPTPLSKYMCVDKLRVCCPEDRYGPNCLPCPLCNGHGKCKGAGTRKGSGKCKCDKGYTGEQCELCDTGYYYEINEKGEKECVKCHKSCKGHCREGGPLGCEVCADGYQYHQQLGCIDIDECLESETPPCAANTFCVNTEASFQCISCDKSCATCDGEGADLCKTCAPGYVRKDSFCIEAGAWRREMHIQLARYATYAGLCIATFIIFKRNSYIASIIGLLVAVYIGFSEYTLGDWEKKSILSVVKNWLIW